MAYKIFDFYCPSCKHSEERYVKDGSVQTCNNCGADMNKLVSAPGMVKGNYFNDKAGVRNVKKT